MPDGVRPRKLKFFVFVRFYPDELHDMDVLVRPAMLEEAVIERLIAICKRSIDTPTEKLPGLALFPVALESESFCVLMHFEPEATPGAGGRMAYRHSALIAYRDEFAAIAEARSVHAVLGQVRWDHPANVGDDLFEADLAATHPETGDEGLVLQLGRQDLWVPDRRRPDYAGLVRRIESTAALDPGKVYTFGIQDPPYVLGVPVDYEVDLKAVPVQPTAPVHPLEQAFGADALHDAHRRGIVDGIIRLEMLSATRSSLRPDEQKSLDDSLRVEAHAVAAHIAALRTLAPDLDLRGFDPWAYVARNPSAANPDERRLSGAQKVLLALLGLFLFAMAFELGRVMGLAEVSKPSSIHSDRANASGGTGS